MELSWLLDLNELEASLGHPGVPRAPIPPLGEWHWLPVVTNVAEPHPDPEHLCAQEILPWAGQRWLPLLPFPCAIWEESDISEVPLQAPPGADGTLGWIQPSLLQQCLHRELLSMLLELLLEF